MVSWKTSGWSLGERQDGCNPAGRGFKFLSAIEKPPATANDPESLRGIFFRWRVADMILPSTLRPCCRACGPGQGKYIVGEFEGKSSGLNPARCFQRVPRQRPWKGPLGSRVNIQVGIAYDNGPFLLPGTECVRNDPRQSGCGPSLGRGTVPDALRSPGVVVGTPLVAHVRGCRGRRAGDLYRLVACCPAV